MGFMFCDLHVSLPGRVAQSVTCLATDACLTADPGVASSIPLRSHTFVEIDQEMISTVILLLPLIHSFVGGYKFVEFVLFGSVIACCPSLCFVLCQQFDLNNNPPTILGQF